MGAASASRRGKPRRGAALQMDLFGFPDQNESAQPPAESDSAWMAGFTYSRGHIVRFMPPESMTNDRPALFEWWRGAAAGVAKNGPRWPAKWVADDPIAPWALDTFRSEYVRLHAQETGRPAVDVRVEFDEEYLAQVAFLAKWRQPITDADRDRARDAGESAAKEGIENYGAKWEQMTVRVIGTKYPASPREKEMAELMSRSHFQARQRAAARPPIRYVHPETGECWSGRGLKPKWVMAAIESGMTLQDLEVQR